MKLRSPAFKASTRSRHKDGLSTAGETCESSLADAPAPSLDAELATVADGVASFLGLGHRDDAVALLAALRRSMRQEVPAGVKLGVASDAGAEIDLEFKVSVRRGEGSSEIATSRVVENRVMPHDPAGQCASDEEISFETLLDNLPVPVFYKNRQGRYIGCNEAFESFLGSTRDQIIGKSVLDISPQNLAKVYSTQDGALFREGGIQQYESTVSAAGGVQRDVVFNKAIFTNVEGEPAGLIGAMLDITERKQTEQKLKEALEFAEGVVAAIPDILFEVDLDGRYLQVWTKNPDLLAQQKAVLLGRTINEVLPPDQAAIAMEAIGEANDLGVSYGSCLRIVLPNGETRWFEHSIAKRPSSDATANTFLMLSRDVTERKQAEAAFDELRGHLVSVLQTIPDMVWLKDVEGSYLLCNHAFGRLVGRAEADIVGKTDDDLFGGEIARFFREKDLEAIDAGRILINEEWVTSQENGQPILLETRKVPVFGPEGRATGVLGVARDITELNASRQKIHQMAFYDALTTLPNRALFNDRLRQMITDAAWHGQRAGVMLIDMDHFKAVNDTMGHPVGDELLCQAAERLKASVRDYDTVARLGGDEFAILLPEIRQGDDLGRIAGKMLEKFNDRFLLDGKEVFVSCSIGIALYPDDSTDADDLVKYADSAMYFAKRSGRSNFRFYSSDLTASAEERLTLESELRRAIERGELELHYQPKILLDSGDMAGSEALLRWRHPKRGMVPPDQFIRIAEDTGLIIDIGRWVLGEACRTAAELNAGGLPPHKVAINLSAREFQSQDLPATVAACLARTGCRAEWIEIEITESLLLNEKDGTLETLSELRAMGISIAIDDFGTGYSALNYLSRFPIDTLKIDRSFINSADGRSAELVKAILSIARCLGQNVVAEGVETVAQAAFLAANGCEAAQGFLYSRPLPKTEFMSLPRRVADMCLAG